MTIELATPRARRTDPATSHEAARFAYSMKASQERLSIFLAVSQHGPMTAREIAKETCIDYIEVQRRISEIPGLKKSGDRRDGCMVWELNP